MPPPAAVGKRAADERADELHQRPRRAEGPEVAGRHGGVAGDEGLDQLRQDGDDDPERDDDDPERDDGEHQRDEDEDSAAFRRGRTARSVTQSLNRGWDTNTGPV